MVTYYRKRVLLLMSIVGFSSALLAETRQMTSMDKIAEQHSLPCQSLLTDLAADVLKSNPHRMLEHFQAIDENSLFNSFTVTDYRDRSSHVTFHGVRNQNGQCQASVVESFALQTDCSDARHEAFSKWTFQGKLNQETFVLSDRRQQDRQAFLTEQGAHLCLVSVRYSITSP